MGPLPLALILARTMNSLSFPVKSFSLGLGLGLGSGIPNPNPNPNPNPSPNPSQVRAGHSGGEGGGIPLGEYARLPVQQAAAEL